MRCIVEKYFLCRWGSNITMNFILTMANACVFLCLNLFLLRMTESSVSSSFDWSDITSSLECYNIKSHVYCTLENDVWGSIFIHCKYVLFDRVSVTKNVWVFFFHLLEKLFDTRYLPWNCILINVFMSYFYVSSEEMNCEEVLNVLVICVLVHLLMIINLRSSAEPLQPMRLQNIPNE